MTLALLLAATVVCPGIVVDDQLAAPWTARDEQALSRAEVGCRVHYGPRACLVRFVRVAPQTYRAICRRR